MQVLSQFCLSAVATYNREHASRLSNFFFIFAVMNCWRGAFSLRLPRTWLVLCCLLLFAAKIEGKNLTQTKFGHEEEVKKASLKFNPLDGLLRFYQGYLSPQIQADCLYHTSCSRFTRKKLRENGIMGFFVGLDQFIHCTSGMELDYPANQLQSGKVVRE